MTLVFLKSAFQKVTKRQLLLPENFPVLDFGVESVEKEFDVTPFELFENGLNPITDFCRKNFKQIKYTYISEVDEAEVYLDVRLPVHHVVVVEEGCSGTVVFDGEGACLASAEIYVREMAEAKVVLLQLDCQEFNFSAMRARVEANAKIDWYLNYFKISNAYSFVQSYLVGREAESNINLVSSSVDNEISDFFAGNCFNAPNCKGQILARGVAKDRSRMSFVGEIEITLQGGGTDSYLKEDVLMLDPTAKIDAVPSLEIKTNDVKAGHGVSVERLNDEKLFYLTSRGISTHEARKLVLSGFLRDSFSRIGIKEVVDRLEKVV